jgi:hypothetical protein
VETGADELAFFARFDGPGATQNFRDYGRFGKLIEASGRALPGDHVEFVAIVEVDHRRAESLADLLAHGGGEHFRIGGDEARVDAIAVAVREATGEPGKGAGETSQNVGLDVSQSRDDAVRGPEAVDLFITEKSGSHVNGRVIEPARYNSGAAVCGAHSQTEKNLEAIGLQEAIFEPGPADAQGFARGAAGAMDHQLFGIIAAGDDFVGGTFCKSEREVRGIFSRS